MTSTTRVADQILRQTFENFIDINPSPHMSILVSSNSAANKDMMSKILTNGDTYS